MINADPVRHLHRQLGGWGAASLSHLHPAALAEYERGIARPEVVHAMCEDYCEALGCGLKLDRRARGDKFRCQLLLRCFVGRARQPFGHGTPVRAERTPFGLSLSKPWWRTPGPSTGSGRTEGDCARPFDRLRANGGSVPFGLSLSKPRVKPPQPAPAAA